MFGPCGTGKDHLAISAGRQVAIEHGVSVKWVHGLRFFAEFRAAIGRGREESEVLQPYIEADVLILSDPVPPAGSVTEWQSCQLMSLINCRWAALKPTWATLNVSDGGEASDRLGAASVDRLRDNSVYVPCAWPSYRQACVPVGPP